MELAFHSKVEQFFKKESFWFVCVCVWPSKGRMVLYFVISILVCLYNFDLCVFYQTRVKQVYILSKKNWEEFFWFVCAISICVYLVKFRKKKKNKFYILLEPLQEEEED
jgi:hypothetical protein